MINHQLTLGSLKAFWTSCGMSNCMESTDLSTIYKIYNKCSIEFRFLNVFDEVPLRTDGTEWFRRERILRYSPRIMPTIGTLFCSLRFGIDPFTPILYGSSLLAIKPQYQQSKPQVSGLTNHLTHQITKLMQKEMKPNKNRATDYGARKVQERCEENENIINQPN